MFVVFLSHSLLDLILVMLSWDNADEKGDPASLSFVIEEECIQPL